MEYIRSRHYRNDYGKAAALFAKLALGELRSEYAAAIDQGERVMCEVCAIFGAGEHWSDFGRLRIEKFPFADIQVYRSERIRRLALLAKILAALGLSVEDGEGGAALMSVRQDRSQTAPPLGTA